MSQRSIIDPSMLESAVEGRVSRDLSLMSSIGIDDLDAPNESPIYDESQSEVDPELPPPSDESVGETIEERYYTIEDRIDNLNGYVESMIELLPQHLMSVPLLEEHRRNDIQMNLERLRDAMGDYEEFGDSTELTTIMDELSNRYTHPTPKLMQMVNTINDLQLVQVCIRKFSTQRVPFWQRRLQRRPSEQELNRAERKLDHYYDEFDETNVLNNTIEDNNWDQFDSIQTRIANWIDEELDKSIRDCVVNRGIIPTRRGTTRRTGEGQKRSGRKTRRHNKHNKRQTFRSKRKAYAGITRREFIKLAMQCRVSREKAQDVWSSFVALGDTMIPHQKNYIDLLRRNMRSSKCAPHPKKTRRLRNIKKISGITKKKFMDAAMRCHNSKRHAEEIWRAFVILGTNIAPHKKGYTRKIKSLGKKTRCARNKKLRKTHKRG